MSLSILIKNLEELDPAAIQILNNYKSNKIFALYGEMGVGKTTLIKSICKNLGVNGLISSPTFSIVNEYENEDGQKLYHFDFYRISSETEAFDIGYEDYFYGNNWCFIEWPEKIQSLLPENAIRVFIKLIKDGERLITI